MVFPFTYVVNRWPTDKWLKSEMSHRCTNTISLNATIFWMTEKFYLIQFFHQFFKFISESLLHLALLLVFTSLPPPLSQNGKIACYWIIHPQPQFSQVESCKFSTHWNQPIYAKIFFSSKIRRNQPCWKVTLNVYGSCCSSCVNHSWSSRSHTSPLSLHVSQHLKTKLFADLGSVFPNCQDFCSFPVLETERFLRKAENHFPPPMSHCHWNSTNTLSPHVQYVFYHIPVVLWPSLNLNL